MGWNNLLFQRKKINTCTKKSKKDNSFQFYFYYVGKTHIILLRLLDKEGLSIVSKLHVQLHRFSIDLYINLQSNSI